jgi:DNA-directed RNA polymerase delta subunit
MNLTPAKQDAASAAALTALRQEGFSLKEVMDDMFLVLTDKEKDVIVKRFSLNNKPRQTLDKIGKHYQVTRERIRQIENIALSKLRRTVSNTKLRYVNRLAKEFLVEEGGVMLEKDLVSRVLSHMNGSAQIDASIIALSLNCDAELSKYDRTSTTEDFWALKEVTFADIVLLRDTALSILRKHGDIMSEEQIVSAVQNQGKLKDRQFSSKLIIGCLKTDKGVRLVDTKWGLMEWRHVNPRSIRDKAIIVLEKNKRPMHFVEIANKISEVGFGKKVVTVQAVHNELIRYDQFVLVGRGLYVLGKWGYKSGTVSDVIEDLLKKNGAMSKKQIVEEVLKQRKVKIGTISLNLQKNPQFVRVGRAVYDFEAKKKA